MKKNYTIYNGDTVSRSLLRNSLKYDNNRNTCGLYFGSCSFVDKHLASFLYKEDISPWWIAGYGAEVNWIESTALEFIFFSKIQKNDHKRKHPVRVIEQICNEMIDENYGLIKNLNFQIFSFDKSNRTLRSLLQYE